MARNKVRAKDAQGFAIHHGEKQTFLLEWLDGTPRVLDDDDAKQYSLWQMRFPAAILIGVFFFSYKPNVPICFALGIAVYVIATILYLFTFVKKLPVAKRFTKEQRDPLPIRLSKNLSHGRLIVSTILLLALSVLLVIYGYTEGYTGMYLYTTLVIAVLTLVLAGVTTYAAILQKRNEK